MRYSYDRSEYPKPGEEFSPPPEQPATLSEKGRYAGAFGVQERRLAAPDEPERQAAEIPAGEKPNVSPSAGGSTKKKHSLLLQFAAVASSFVLITSSFGIDFLGLDGLFNDSVIFGEASTEPDASGRSDDGSGLIYGNILPLGEDSTFPQLDNSDRTVTQEQTADADNRYIAAVDFVGGSMGEQAMVEGFVWCGQKDPRFLSGPIPMSFSENTVSAESSSISYDSGTNTLTLNNYHGKGLMINNMGQDFTVRLEGDSVLSEYLLVGCGSVTITGNGGITINKDQKYDYGIHVAGQWSNACLMLDGSIKFDISGGHSIFRVSATCAEKPVWYKVPYRCGEICQGRLKAEDNSIIPDDPEHYYSWLMVAGDRAYSTVVTFNNSYQPAGEESTAPAETNTEPSSEMPEGTELPGLPVGGDSAFPILPNPDPNTPVEGGYGILDEDYIQVFDRTSNRWEFLYVNRNQELNTVSQSGISYDRSTNTLTLNNYHGAGISANMMGNRFTVELIGENVLTQDFMIWGFYTAGSVHFTGSGSLSVNTDLVSPIGLDLECEFSKSCIMIDESVTLDIYGSTYALIVNGSIADKGVYLISPAPSPGVRQIVLNEEMPDVDWVSQRPHKVWILTGSDTGDPLTRFRIEGTGSVNSR